jgi:type IV secretory pathway VirB3-like protein
MQVIRALTDPPMPLGVEPIPLGLSFTLAIIPVALSMFSIPVFAAVAVLWFSVFLCLRTVAEYDKRYFKKLMTRTAFLWRVKMRS